MLHGSTNKVHILFNRAVAEKRGELGPGVFRENAVQMTVRITFCRSAFRRHKGVVNAGKRQSS